jgi:hypothetical protein
VVNWGNNCFFKKGIREYIMSKVNKLGVHHSRRFLEYSNGSPFFYLGDTAWELFHVLNKEEGEWYLKDRAAKGFNVIQAVALAERDGLKKPNAYGCFPLKKNNQGIYDPTLPDLEGDYSYWDHMDYLIDLAGSLNIFMGLLPTWGDKFTHTVGIENSIFTPENALAYGRFIGRRYKDRENIIWIMGGDRTLETIEHHEIINNMAKGIKESGDSHMMTFHPRGCSSSSQSVHNREWLDFNMIQTGHSTGGRYTFDYLKKDYEKTPVKPVINGEPLYEDIPVDFTSTNGYYDEFDVRVAAYRSVFAGACGHTYGQNNIWAMTRPHEVDDFFIMTWDKGVARPGSTQMGYLKKLILDHDFFSRIPSQSALEEEGEGELRQSTCRGEDYLLIYSPYGRTIWLGDDFQEKEGNKIPLRGRWFDPRIGEYSSYFELSRKEYIKKNKAWYDLSPIEKTMGKEIYRADPPTQGRGQDWVLVILDILPE